MSQVDPAATQGTASGPAKADPRASAVTAVTVAASEPGDRPVRPAATVQVAHAHQELLAARRAFAAELDGLTTSTQASLDIPAKIRKEPLKAAALAGGAGFLILGGPKKVLRRVGRALPKRRRDPYAGLLPDEVEKVLRDTGLARDPRVREALDHDFAEYLRRKGRTDAQPNARASLWRTYDVVVGPLGTVGARMLVERLMAANGGKGNQATGASTPGPTDRPRG
jgi:hypothetical protein